MAYGGAGPVLGYKAGTYRPETFTGDQTGIQSMLDYIGVGGHGYIGPGSYTNLTNLTQYGKSLVTCAGPLASILTRSASATGIFWREKTAAEGNAVGASGIGLRGLGLYGNGSAGDGLNLGNQGGASFTSNAYLSDILVRDFVSGTAIKLLANAIHVRDVWAAASLIGFHLDGGANHVSGLWIENNREVGLRCNSYGNTFAHIHAETGTPVPTAGLIEFTSIGDKNVLVGLDLALDVNSANLIVDKSGAAGNEYFGIKVTDNGFTWTNTIYNEVWSAGTGNKGHIPVWVDSANSAISYFYDKSSNRAITVIGPVMQKSIIALTDAATIAVNAAQGQFFTVTLAGNRTMGAPSNPSNGQHVTFEITQDATGGRTLAWDAAFKTAWSDAGNTLNKKSTISFWYNGTNWMQVGAQSAYI